MPQNRRPPARASHPAARRRASAQLTEGAVHAVLVDLLMATMDSISTWSLAAGDRERGLAWRDAVTARMMEAERYTPYEQLVRAAAGRLHLPADAPDRLRASWLEMRRWPDAGALEGVRVPYAFVANCSTELASEAAERSGLEPTFTLSAEEAGWYKPRAEIYRLACKRIGASAYRTLFVAGTPYDAAGARDAGLQVRLVRRRPDQLSPPGIRAVDSLREIAQGLGQVSSA